MNEPPRPAARVREHSGLIVCVATYVVGFVAYGLATGAKLTTAYGVIVVVAAVFVGFVHVRVGFSSGVLWCLAVWGLAHMAGGLIEFSGDAVLYNVDWGVPFLRYDRLVHAFGFGTTSVVCWQLLRNRVGVTHVTTAVAVIVWLGGMGVGAFNEVVEFVMSQLVETNVGGYVNTGYDLVFNMLGTATVAGWLRLRRSD